MSNYSTYSLGTNQIALLTIAYNDAEASSDPYGRYARVYELLFSMISTDGSGAYVSESDLTSINLQDYWDNWKQEGEGLDEVDMSDWEKVDAAIDDAAWAFLAGVSKVNWGLTPPETTTNPTGEEFLYSKFIRAYSIAQHDVRFGTSASYADTQEASDGIARNIIRDILSLDDNGVPDTFNSNHYIPTISGIALNDANAAVDGLDGDGLFDNEQIGGWAGNPFLTLIGYDDVYRKNILNEDQDDYGLSTESPKAGVENSLWLWLYGARDVNSETKVNV